MTTRAELEAAVGRWLRRSGDPDLTADMGTLIRNAEERIAREVRHSSQETVSTLTLNGRSVALPADCVEVRSLTVQGDNRRLELVTAEVLREGPLWNASGNPCWYAIHGRDLYVAPSATATLDIVYWARPPALTADADTNFLLTQHFSLYLYATLAEAAVFLQDRDAELGYGAKYADTRRTLQEDDIAYHHSGSVPRRIGSSFVV